MSRARRLLTLCRRTLDRLRPPRRIARLHIGCGREHLGGWTNVDLEAYRGVDVVADVTRGLRFRDVEAIYAEHFLENLPVERAVAFLLEAHRVLTPGGQIRLSTPNLDWVWVTHYRLDVPAGEKVELGIRANRAFRAWGHRFVWNRELLEEAL